MIILPILTWFVSLIGAANSGGRDSQLDDIREAVFRHQFVHNASGLQQSAAVYFLALRNPATKQSEDPSDAFMERFAAHIPRVAKISDVQSSRGAGVRDKHTGEHGLIFSIRAVRWLSAESVEVNGGYYEAGESASGNTYRLTKKSGHWVVQSDKMNWISRRETRPTTRFAASVCEPRSEPWPFGSSRVASNISFTETLQRRS